MKYTGTINLRNGIVLKSVLYVPQFRFNLSVVNKLILDFKCSISFNNNGCFIQEMLMKKPWLLGKPRSGLYVLQDTTKKDISHHTEDFNGTILTALQDTRAKLWNLRLGHLPMYRLRLLFPDIDGKAVNKRIIYAPFFLRQNKTEMCILNPFVNLSNLWMSYILIYGDPLNTILDYIVICL